MRFTTDVSIDNDAYATYSLNTFVWSETGQSQSVYNGNCVSKIFKIIYYQNNHIKKIRSNNTSDS